MIAKFNCRNSIYLTEDSHDHTYSKNTEVKQKQKGELSYPIVVTTVTAKKND